MRITLDAETFRALASTTRLAVLRALDERRKTLSELARDLALNKATVHEHLALLSAAELVKKRDDEGRKWIYYELTWRGQKILHPQETTTFNVLLGLSVLAAGGGAAMLVQSLLSVQDQVRQTNFGDLEAADAAPAPNSPAAAQGSSASGASSVSGSQSAAQSSAASTSPAGGAAQNAALADTAGTKSAGVQPAAEHDSLWNHGGAIALAVVGIGLLCGLLALVLRRRLRPKKAESPGLA